MNRSVVSLLPLLVALAAPAALTASAPVAASVLKPTGWVRAGGAAGVAFGQSVVPAGDINGDGRGDLLVGAPGHDGGQPNGGAAFLFLGSAGGPGLLPSWSYFGTQGAAALGTTVSPAGDINGDGYADILVGAPLFDGNGGVDQGHVHLFLGSPSGLPASPSQTITQDLGGGHFGAAIAPAGDIDADGYDDVLVGAPRSLQFFSGEGAVYLFQGGPGGLLGGPTWSKFGGAFEARLGAAVSGAGDVNADGFADIVVGAPGRSNILTAEGAAYVFAGNALGLANLPIASRYGLTDSAAFGAAVSLAGDVDADGYADVLIGAPNHGPADARVGRVALVGGSASGLGAELWHADGATLREFFGATVATLGDVNGDGYPDFAIGADRWPAPAERIGRVVVYLGGAAGPESEDSFGGGIIGEALGAGLGTAGDFDGDGFSDLVIGGPGATVDFAAEGRVTFYRGSASLPILAPGWPFLEAEAGAGMGIGLAGGVDIFGNMTSTFFFGAWHADAGFIDAGSVRRAHSAHPSPTPEPLPILTGHRAGASLGHTLARAGDVNGDRYEDLLAGSATYTNGQGFEGLTQVFHGSDNGPIAPAAWSYEPNIVGARAGFDIDGGDFNGDGYADVLLGAINDGLGEASNGFAKAFYGSPAGLPALPSWTTLPQTGSAFFGQLVATGDWDGDSFTDAAISAQDETNGQAQEGRVHVYFGGPGGLDANPAWILERNLVGARFGLGLANGGDINGDGVSDLLVGAPNALEASHPNVGGEVWIVFGDRSRARPQLRRSQMVLPDIPASNFGNTVAGIGDIDKDGYGDFLVGSPFHSNGQSNEGRVWLFRGSPDGAFEIPWWSTESNVAESYFGSSLTPAGDINDDGWPDFAVGAHNQGGSGAAYVYLGGGGATFKRVAQATTNSALPLGGMLSTASDLFVYHTVRTPAGRVKARPEIQVATQNEAWSGGTRTSFGPFDSGVPSFATRGSSSLWALPQPALTPGVAYRLRARNLPHSPYFPPTPWSQPRSMETAFPHFRVAGSVVDAGDGTALPRTGVSLRAIQPSPFRDGARIRYRLPRAGAVALDVFDARGRHVRRLVAAAQAAGDHDVAFDGRGEDGAAIAAGVYFAVLTVDGERAVRKVVRVP